MVYNGGVEKGKNPKHITQKYVLRSISNTNIIIPLDKAPENLTYIDETGKTFWKYLKKYKDKELTSDKLAEHFQISKKTIQKDLNQFIKEIEKENHKESEENKINNYSDTYIPIKGSIELTGRCNLRCKHCYAVGERIKPQLETKQIKELINQIAKSGTLFLQLTGGECMHRKDFAQIYKHIRKKGIIPTISTNATMLNEKILKTLEDYPPEYIRISIYGADETTHEEITQIKGSFKRMVDNVKKLKNIGIPVYFSAVMFKSNIKSIEKIKEMAQSLNVPILFYSQIIPTLEANTDPLELSIDEKIDVTKYNDIPEDFRPPKSEVYKIGNTYNCNAGKNSYHIDCGGNLYICKAERTNGISILENTFNEAWKKLNILRNTLLEYPTQCSNCGRVEVCKSCPVKVRLAQKALVPYWFCSIKKEGDIENIL